ncbi:protein FAR1-related sequence 6, partial [Tanacetum coccineum]
MEVNVTDLNDSDTDILSFMDSTKNIVHDNSNLNHQHVEPSNVQSSSHPLSIPSSPDKTQQVSTTKIPNAGMKFDSEEELQLYFQEYAYQVGFGFRRTSVRTKGDKKYYGLACSKRGVHVPKSGSARTRLSMVEANGYENLPFGERDCRNHIAKADARSRAAYESFGDVDGETYVWLFKSWLACMDGHAPKSIITDQCRSMQAAVAQIFHESYHRLCLWHIMKKIPEKLDDSTSVYHVTDIVERKHELKKRVVYNHMVKILIEKDVKELPSRYILSRWRKDVKHRYNFITNCYDDLKSGEQVKQFDHLCTIFYEAANIIQRPILFQIQRANPVSDSTANSVSDSTAPTLLPPSQGRRGRGRPPKRKKSIVEKVMEKQNKKNASQGKKDKLRVERDSSMSNMADKINVNSADKANNTSDKHRAFGVH